MNKIFLFLFCTFLGCSRRSVPVSSSANVPEGYYTANDGLFNMVFLKVSGNKAFADFITYEKFPRALFTDTLAYNGNIWKGSGSGMYVKGRSWRISRGNDTFVQRMKIRENEAFYKEKADGYKNAAFSRKYYEDFIKENPSEERRRKYAELELKYGIDSIANTLPHEAFLKEYGKFREEWNR